MYFVVAADFAGLIPAALLLAPSATRAAEDPSSPSPQYILFNRAPGQGMNQAVEALCHEAARAGVPRERLFAHGAGWKEGELVYDVPVSPYACPGWSFYQHAGDPRQDAGVRRNLARSEAPSWAATEWLFQGPRENASWRKALANTLSDPRCRYVCIFNWESIRSSEPVLKSIAELVEAGGRDKAQAGS